MPTLTPAATATGTLSVAAAVNGDGLYCSETLACSDVDVICTDLVGTNAAPTATGTLAHA